MMIQYFRARLAAEEDVWFLLMDNAERAVLLALGFDEEEEEALPPLYEMLGPCILQ